jgi:hypothetical protein
MKDAVKSEAYRNVAQTSWAMTNSEIDKSPIMGGNGSKYLRKKKLVLVRTGLSCSG